MRKTIGTLALLLLMAQMTFGTTLVRMDLDDLTSQSNAVVYGRIAASRTEWNTGHTMIYTVYTVEAIDYLKGQLGATFELREMGGELDGLGMRVAGVPVFAPGEESVLFVWTDPNGIHQVIGFEQGALQVQSDPQTGAKTVDRAIRLGSARVTTPGPVMSTSKSLTELFGQIRSSAAAAAKADAGKVGAR